MHRCVDSLSFVVSLALSLARSLSPYHRVSLALSKVRIQCISFLLSPALALSHSPFQPLSRLHLSLFPVFSISLPPFRLHSLSTLSSCPQPRSLDRIRARAYVFTLKSQIIFGDRQLVSTSRSKSWGNQIWGLSSSFGFLVWKPPNKGTFPWQIIGMEFKRGWLFKFTWNTIIN